MHSPRSGGHSSPGSLHAGQHDSNGSRQMPHTSSASAMFQCHVATKRAPRTLTDIPAGGASAARQRWQRNWPPSGTPSASSSCGVKVSESHGTDALQCAHFQPDAPAERPLKVPHERHAPTRETPRHAEQRAAIWDIPLKGRWGSKQTENDSVTAFRAGAVASQIRIKRGSARREPR